MPQDKSQNPKPKSQNHWSLEFGHWSLEFGHWKLKKAFTLIELLVAISILSLLVAAGTVSWSTAQRRGRDEKRKNDVATIQHALTLYFQDNGKYPPTAGAGSWQWCARISDGTYPDVKNALTGTYIQQIPNDPNYNRDASVDYIYYVTTDRSQYKIYAVIENSKDTDYLATALATDGFSWCGSYGDNSKYNYKAISP